MKFAISKALGIGSMTLSFGVNAVCGSAQTPGVVAAGISREELVHQIEALAPDSMRGLATPSAEIERTATYVAEQFRRIGIAGQGKDTAIMRYPIPSRQHVDYATSELTFFLNGVKNLDGKEYRNEEGRRMIRGNVVDFKTGVRVASPSLRADLPESASEHPVVVAGRHTTTSVSVSSVVGKVVVYVPPAGVAPSEYRPMLDTLAVLAEGVIVASDADSATFAGEVQAARQQPRIFEAAPLPGDPKRRAWVLYVRDVSLAPWLLSGGMDLSQLRGEANPTVRFLNGGFLFYRVYPDTTDHSSQMAPNVVGRLPGSDSVLAKQWVVVSASMEACGTQDSVRTADSAVAPCRHVNLAGLLALAGAFSGLTPRPRRSILFLATSGSREGGWGSAAFASAVPRGATIVHLDLDANRLGDTIVVDGTGDVEGAVTPTFVAALHPEFGLAAQDGPTAFDSPTEAVAFAQVGSPTLIVHSPEVMEKVRRPLPSDTVITRMERALNFVFLLTRAFVDDDRQLDLSPKGRSRFLELQRMP